MSDTLDAASPDGADATTGDETTRAERTAISRRGFVKAAGATGAGLAAVTTGTDAVWASHGHSSYEILEGTEHEQTVYVYRAPTSGATTVVVAGIHGDEKAGYMAADRIANWTVDRGELIVIPRANPKAIAQDHRPWSNDLNRQFQPTGGSCETRLASAIWAEVDRHDPEWVFDLHSSRGILDSGDGGVGQAMFPTWTSPARSTGENTVAALNDRFGLTGDMAYIMGNTLDADRDMLMHRVAGVMDQPGFLCETTEKAPLDEQIAWHLFTVEYTMAQYGQNRVESSDSTSSAAPSPEARTIVLDDPWAAYGLSGSHDDPAVFAPAITYRGPQPAHSRVRSVSAGGFEAKAEEWHYQNGAHYDERAGMLALDPGTYTLADGRSVEVGRTSADHNFTGVSFDAGFGSRPALITQSQTGKGSDAIVTRARNVSTSGCEVCVQEEDGEENGGYHYPEEVAYVAVEPGAGSFGGRTAEAGLTTVDHNWTRISFDRSYSDPVFLASVQSYDGWNSVSVRYGSKSSSRVNVKLHEEQSDDAETTHVPETVGYLVLEG